MTLFTFIIFAATQVALTGKHSLFFWGEHPEDLGRVRNKDRTATPASIWRDPAAKELLEAKPDATREEVREWMSGNYCRCTGYQAIIDAICETLAERAKNSSSRPSEKVSG